MTTRSNSAAPPLGERDAAILTWMHEIAPYGVITTDGGLHVSTWNQWMTTHSGLDENAVRGRSLLDLYPDLKARRLDEHYRRALGGEVSVLASALHRYLIPMAATVRDGGYPRMQQTARIAPLRLDHSILGTITIIQDVTHREVQATRLRQQHEREQLLSWALAFLLQAREPRDAVAQILPKVASTLGLEIYSAYRMEPKTDRLQLDLAGGASVDLELVPSTLSADRGLCGRCTMRREPVVVANLQQSRDADAAAARRLGMRACAAFPLLIGDQLLGTLSFGSTSRDVITASEIDFLATLTQYVAVAIDRAEREHALAQAQLALSKHAGELENKVAERTAALNETIVQLESFSYTVAHDLRAPIRSLTGYCDILLTDYRTQIPEDAQVMLRKLHRASARLDALTRDLLRFSRVTREELELSVVDVGELIDEIVQVTPTLQHGTLTVQRPLHRVWAQRTLLQQCLSNLFDNALKFVGPDRVPHIVVRTEKSPSAEPTGASTDARAPEFTKPNKRVRIVVQDNGIGIPPESQQRIFGIFERVSGGFEGTGIGLAIVERASQRMGGSCGVISKVGHGSSFWIELSGA